jgi:hypothetical protein
MLRMVCHHWRKCVTGMGLLLLAGCAGHYFAQREPWRKEAELSCLKSGAVKESGTIVRVEPINGPGVCGADFPLKVAALGDQPLMGYSDLRPPGSVPNAGPQRWPVRTAPPSRTPPQTYSNEERTFANPARPAAVQRQPLAPSGGSRRPSVYDAPSEPAYDDEDVVAPPNMSRSPYPMPQRTEPYQTPLRAVPAHAARSQSTVPMSRSAIAALGPVEIKPAATLACPMVSALDRWIMDSVQPAARRWFRQPVVEIRQISAYSCRGMNGQPGARISEHAFGNALDIASFTLADGRKITVKNGWRGSPEEQGFLRDVQGAACDQFNTVLAPGSNRFHYDHFHFDLMRRGSGSRICNPDQISGEVVAARVARERGYAGRPDTGSTGSIGNPRATSRSATLNGKPKSTASPRGKRNILDDDDWIEDEGPRPAE